MFKDEIFNQAFEKTELANLGQTELDKYEMNLKAYRDYKNTIDTAFNDGEASGEMKGRTKEKLEIAKALKSAGISTAIISQTTGLSSAEIENL